MTSAYLWVEGTYLCFTDADGNKRGQAGTTTCNSGTVSGQVWIEGDNIHYIDESLAERYLPFSLLAASAGSEGFWLEDTTVYKNYLHYITSAGNHNYWHGDSAHADHSDGAHSDHSDYADYTDYDVAAHLDHDDYQDTPHGDVSHSDYSDHDDWYDYDVLPYYDHTDHSDVSHMDTHADYTDHDDSHSDWDNSYNDAAHDDWTDHLDASGVSEPALL